MYNILEANEYPSFYSTYVKLVSEGDFTDILAKQLEETINFLQGISDQQALFRYAPEKWNLKEVMGHMADTERIMAYRLLSIARGETLALPGFNENDYVQNAAFTQQSVEDLLQNLVSVRQSTIHLIKNLTREELLRSGTVNDAEVTVRALIAIIAGHELHHRNIIRDRYIQSAEYPAAK